MFSSVSKICIGRHGYWLLWTISGLGKYHCFWIILAALGEFHYNFFYPKQLIEGDEYDSFHGILYVCFYLSFFFFSCFFGSPWPCICYLLGSSTLSKHKATATIIYLPIVTLIPASSLASSCVLEDPIIKILLSTMCFSFWELHTKNDI